MALSLSHPACIRRVRIAVLISLPIAGRERPCGILTRRFSLLAQAPAPGLPARRTAPAACLTPSHASIRSGNGAATFGGGGGPWRYVAPARWGTRRAAGAGDGTPGTSDDDDEDTSEGPSDQDRGAPRATERQLHALPREASGPRQVRTHESCDNARLP